MRESFILWNSLVGEKMLDSPAAVSAQDHERMASFAGQPEDNPYHFTPSQAGTREVAPRATLGPRSIFDAQVWMARSPWQPAAGWSVIAALLSWVPLTQWFGSGSVVDWRLIALLLLLVDPLWGSVWRFASGRASVLPLRSPMLRSDFWLPYLGSDSPAMRLMGGGDAVGGHAIGNDARDIYPLLLRVAIPSTLLALAVAAVLGIAAIGLTCIVILLTVLAWTSSIAGREREQFVASSKGFGAAHLLQALITVALPWALALLLMRGAESPDTVSATAEATLQLGERMWISSVLLGLWTLHSWGESRCLQQVGDRIGIGLLAASNLGIALLLIALGVPMALGILGIIWFATWYAIYSRSSLRSIQGWWLLAMLVSAAAVGFAM